MASSRFRLTKLIMAQMWYGVPDSPSNSEFRIVRPAYHERVAATTRCPGGPGYTIISNSSATEDSFSGTGIWFTGHRYNGQIGALSSFDIPGISLSGNTVEITLTPQ
jgi:hypothetical protein